MRYLTIDDALNTFERINKLAGYKNSISSIEILLHCLCQPLITFSGKDLYQSISFKAASLCKAIIDNKPCSNFNTVYAHAIMEVFLRYNGFMLNYQIDEQETLLRKIEVGRIQLSKIKQWIDIHLVIYHPGDTRNV
jgi:prophage maintenance system killer protein